MPIDDSRPARLSRPAPSLAAVDDPAREPGSASPEFADEDPELRAELHRQIEDIESGREPLGLPWEEARRLIFAPPTPEELAELEKFANARARR